MNITLTEIEEWRDAHWGEVVGDIANLVEVASVEDLEGAREGAPFGEGPREALDRALAMARRCGLDAHDCDGYIGFADLHGASPEQIGIIGHVDVVPAGPGWSVEPYAVTRREGYLMGRGVIDDKGPIVVALYAVRFWAERFAERGGLPPATVRVLFGANEETNMKDVDYYRAHFADPAFLLTPDSQFPLGYGESGICSGTLVSAPIANGQIADIAGGQAVNAVPGEAFAIVRDDAGERKFEAQGVSAHAIDYAEGVNAIGVLVDKLLDAGAGAPDERAFLELLRSLHGDTSGAVAGIACADEHFGDLSMIGGIVGLRRGNHPARSQSVDDGQGDLPDADRIFQTLDFRYPTAITAAEIERGVNELAGRMAPGATFRMEHDKQPFLMDPDSPQVRALLDAYRAATGEDARGMTSKGGTYARCFTAGVSFGPEKPWVPAPDWAGGMHGHDEAVSEGLLREAFSVYALALGNLFDLQGDQR